MGSKEWGSTMKGRNMKASNHNRKMTLETVERQRQYVAGQRKKGAGTGLVFTDAFLRGIRDLGYKNPAWALAEKIDNSCQAGASRVSIRFGFAAGNNTEAKPDYIALIDDGNGMIPEMISYAVRWGGTDRENDRSGFGRYGYGLPSSAIYLACRYTVYSKVPGEPWYAVTVDLDALAEAAGDNEEVEKLLRPRRVKLPSWVVNEEDVLGSDNEIAVGELDSGTLIVLEDLDRLRRMTGWITASVLKSKLLQHFGVIYRHWIPKLRIFVQGVEAQAVDPLFLMEHGRFFDETPVRAIRISTKTSFEVSASDGSRGWVRIRASLLPPDFQLADPAHYGRKGAKMNSRHQIMRDYNGLLICRGGRQIDCITPRWTKFQNYDAHVKIEIDFDPTLDEFFGMTTAKQQIVVDDDMWEKLIQNGKNAGGLEALVRSIRMDFTARADALKVKVESSGDASAPRPSEIAMTTTEKFKGPVIEPSARQKEEARRNLEAAAEEEAARTGRPAQEVKQKLLAATTARRWQIEFAAIPEGPFYRPKRLGEQKRLIINTEHPFYKKVYSTTPAVRAALEVLLLVLAERELESREDAETFYRAERNRWSERLRFALDTLVSDESMSDMSAAFAERMSADEPGPSVE